MKYTVTNNYRDANMTCLMGYVNTTYARLVKVFGKPIDGDSGDGKVNSEWIIKFANGEVATIYNYKTGTTPTDDYDWHIGGNKKWVVAAVSALVAK
jgi:hypothetical protein